MVEVVAPRDQFPYGMSMGLALCHLLETLAKLGLNGMAGKLNGCVLGSA